MKNALKFGCLGLLALGVLIAGGLFILAWMAEPLPTTEEALATVPETERAALEQVCAAAGLKPGDLRHIAAHDDAIFSHELNKHALVVKDGHITALCLRGAEFRTVPDFRGLTMLETLDAHGSRLSAWPDLSALGKLHRLKFSATDLSDADASSLPPAVGILQLSGTKLTKLDAFAGLKQLKKLDASQTQVSGFESLCVLALDELNLAGTKVATLPATVPAQGAWEVNLDNTPVTSPPGFARSLPGGGNIGGSDKSDEVQGTLTREKAEGQGRLVAVTQRRRVQLPRGIIPDVPPVTLEVSIASGKARVWLREPPGMFNSPWFERRKIKGFGLMRLTGWVSQEVTPAASAKLHGRLDLVTKDRTYEVSADIRRQPSWVRPPDWCDHSFIVEPVDGAAVSEVTFRITGP